MLTAEPATTLARLVRSGEVTASEIVAAYLKRIAVIEAAVGAFHLRAAFWTRQAVDEHRTDARRPCARRLGDLDGRLPAVG